MPRPIPLILAALVGSAGCMLFDRGYSSSDFPTNPVRLTVNTALLGTPSGIPSMSPPAGSPDDVIGRNGAKNGWLPEYSDKSHGNGDKSGDRITFEFRCVDPAGGPGQDKKGWLLPADEYPQIMKEFERELWVAVEKAGGKVTSNRLTGSTLEMEYTCPRYTGTIRGRIGPASGHYTRVEVDVTEVLDRIGK
jgi:hypothetical protein